MVLAFILLMVASLSLFGSLWELGGGAPWPRHPMVPACWTLLCGGGSVALYLGGYPSIYSETELWSAALAMVTLCCGLAVLRSPSLRSVTSCGGAALLTVATRSAVGLGSLALLGMLAVVLWLSTLERSPRCQSVMVSLLPSRSLPERRRLGAVLGLWSGGIVALSIVVNEAKFGTAFSVPVRSQGVATDGLSPAYTAFVQHHSSFTELAALPSTLLWYFQPFALHFSSLFPFVNFPATIHVLNPEAFEGLNPSSSIPSSMPLLFVLALVGCGGLIVRRLGAAVVDGTSFRRRAAVVLVAAAASMVGMLTYPGIAHRHLGDALEDRADRRALGFQEGLALGGDGIELLAAAFLGGGVAELFQEGQGRIDDAGAGAIGAADRLLDGLDQLVAVARLLADQLEQNQAQVALFEHPLRPPAMTAHAHAAALPAPAPAKAVTREMGAVFVVVVIVKMSHVRS
jgi:hypothetical protein